MKRRITMAGWRERLAIFGLFVCALVTVELAHDVYRVFAFAEERAELRVLNDEVADAGVAVLKSQLRADSLKIRLEQLNTVLEGARDSVNSYDRRAARGRLGPAEYTDYRRRVDAYNRRVAEQNASLNELQDAITANRHAVRRYNQVAERIRTLAASMGELHYNIPSPVEAAVRTGLRPE
jgi:uncharacterized coiled-coil protein SlyX